VCVHSGVSPSPAWSDKTRPSGSIFSGGFWTLGVKETPKWKPSKFESKQHFYETYVCFLSTEEALKQEKLRIIPAHLSHNQWRNWQGSGLRTSNPLGKLNVKLGLYIGI